MGSRHCAGPCATGRRAVDLLIRLHRELLRRDAGYAERAACAVALAMNRTWAPVWRAER